MKTLSERVEFAKDIAKQAGIKLKELRLGEVDVVSKGRNDLLTIADGISEELIITAIKQNYPEDGIIGEESGNTQIGTTEYTWVVDPLDGTVNYAHNLPIYGVSVGLMKGGNPYGGAIYLPVLDELAYCERNCGAYCNDKRLSVSDCTEFKKAYCVDDYNNRDITKREYADEMHKVFMHNSMNALSFICATFFFTNVAKGCLDCYFGVGFGLWDFCVGVVLVEEAGGKWSGPNGEELDYSHKGEYIGLATNGKIHDEVVEKLSS